MQVSNLVRSAVVAFSTMLPITAGCNLFNKHNNEVDKIEIISGGADCIAGAGMEFKIGENIYAVDYGSFGISHDTLIGKDGLPVEDGIKKLVRCYEKQMIDIACDLSYGQPVDSKVITVNLADCK